MITLSKRQAATSLWAPLEAGSIRLGPLTGSHVLTLEDSRRREYLRRPVRGGQTVRFAARGAAGEHRVRVCDEAGVCRAEATFVLKAATAVSCDRGPYGRLLQHLRQMIERESESRPWVINDRTYRMLVCWSRDHVYTLKAARYFIEDVTSGLEYWLETQEPNGMFWDCIHPNTEAPAASWFGEALGEGWYRYDDRRRYIVRRVPVLADTEYVFAEGVWYAWKATGDDAWMAAQLPKLEKALTYLTTDPLRWSRKHGLVRRSFTADEWDFANPHYCAGDHRCIHPGDARFLFHGNNSGLYAMMNRMAEMHECLGQAARGAELRRRAEALRGRANATLFFGTQYGHMIPETLDPQKVYARVGDERERMSLSTGYTINRGLPTHAMAVKILREYQRRARARRGESFAEWWTMDPSYTPAQWPGQHTNAAGCPQGEYMNGGICAIVAGEIAKAAFDHGFEAYGVDILDRLWQLSERDGGHLHQVYRRLPARPRLPRARFQCLDLTAAANRGLRHGARNGVPAWTDEGTNDMRHLPVGRRAFGAITFNVIDPVRNAGRSVVALEADGRGGAPAEVTVAAGGRKARSLYVLHALARTQGANAVVGAYDVHYADGVVERLWVRERREVGLWWGINDTGMDRKVARRAWWGANPQWKTVGLFMCGWNNPRPDVPITGIRLQALRSAGRAAGLLVAGLSLSDQAVAFEPQIRSYGLPDCWSQGAVYYAIAEGLAGIEDQGRAFDRAGVSPRWAATGAGKAEATLHYPASGAYSSYRYTLDRRRRRIVLDVTGSGDETRIHCLLPGRAVVREVRVGRVPVPFAERRIEQSRYVDIELAGLPREPVTILY